MKTYTIEGLRSMLRINDDQGKLVAYVAGDPRQLHDRAELIIKALNGELVPRAPTKVGPALCRTCRDELITEVPATGDGQCVDCWLEETES